MRRVVITGMGVISSIGTGRQAVLDSLREGRSGIRSSEEYRDMGFRSHVHGPIDLPLDELIDRKLKRFMSDGAAYNYLALREAIADAALDDVQVSSPRTGLIVGSGGASTENVVWCADTARQKGPRKVGPYMVTRCMNSAIAANLGTALKIKGVSYTISSACATSAHCIGNAAELDKHLSFDMCRWTSALNDLTSGVDPDKIRQKLGISKIQWREVSQKLRSLAKEYGYELTSPGN